MPQPGSLQKSFIPKSGAGVTGGRSSRSSFATIPNIIAGALFFAVAGSAIGVFVYGQYLESQIEDIKAQIAQAYDNINLDRQEELRAFDARLDAGERLLRMHHAPSRLLTSIGDATLARIQFDVLELTMMDGAVLLTIEGTAPDFASVAAQADELRSNSELQSALVNDLEIDQSDVGNVVAFTMEAQIRPEAIRFQPRAGSRNEPAEIFEDIEADDTGDEPAEVDSTDTEDLVTEEDDGAFVQEEVEDNDPEDFNEVL